MEITKMFTHDKTTTNKYRFQETTSDGRQLTQGEADIGTIYVPKRLFSGNEIPKAIWVTVTDIDLSTDPE